MPLRLVLAAVSGLALGVAFPPYGLWWLTAPAVAAITLLTAGLRARAGAVVGLVAGVAFFGLLLRWLLVIGADAWVLVSTLEALSMALVGAGTAVLVRLRGWPVYVAGLWVAVEELRAVVPFGGFPWGRLAFAQADGPFKGLAAMGGMALVTFAVAFAGTLLAAALRRATASVDAGARTDRLARLRPAAALIAAAVAVALVGLLVPLRTDGSSVTAAVVQGDVPRSGLDAFGQRAAVLDNHVRATEQLAARVSAGRGPATAAGGVAGELHRHRPVRRRVGGAAPSRARSTRSARRRWSGRWSPTRPTRPPS